MVGKKLISRKIFKLIKLNELARKLHKLLINSPLRYVNTELLFRVIYKSKELLRVQFLMKGKEYRNPRLS